MKTIAIVVTSFFTGAFTGGLWALRRINGQRLRRRQQAENLLQAFREADNKSTFLEGHRLFFENRPPLSGRIEDVTDSVCGDQLGDCICLHPKQHEFQDASHECRCGGSWKTLSNGDHEILRFPAPDLFSVSPLPDYAERSDLDFTRLRGMRGR